MPRPRDLRRPATATFLGLLVALSIAAAACGTSGPSASPRPTPASTTVAAASPSADASSAPEPTAVPGGETVSPGPLPTHKPTTTNTQWGVILDRVPDDFPSYPGARGTEDPDGPVSQALVAPADVDTVSRWYRDALDAAGYATLDLSDPLEDGSRVLDSQADIPECRVQTTFRPQDGSTMISVLFAAGCVAIGG